MWITAISFYDGFLVSVSFKFLAFFGFKFMVFRDGYFEKISAWEEFEIFIKCVLGVDKTRDC